MDEPGRTISKRPKQEHGAVWGDLTDSPPGSSNWSVFTPSPHSITPAFTPTLSPTNTSSFSPPFTPFFTSSPPLPNATLNNLAYAVKDGSPGSPHGRKRALDFATQGDSGMFVLGQQLLSDDQLDTRYFLEFSPANISPDECAVPNGVYLPFDEADTKKFVRQRPQIKPKDGIVNGYIKMTVKLNKPTETPILMDSGRLRRHSTKVSDTVVTEVSMLGLLPLPHGYGRDIISSKIDEQLWGFFNNAFCSGRTLLKNSHCWQKDFARIANHEPMVWHAALCIASTYVMDFSTKSQYQDRANFHYDQASYLLNKAIRDNTWTKPGMEDVVVTALNIMACEDVISYEDRKKKNEDQKWYRATQNALYILDACNPMHNYSDPVNVQTRSTREGNANLLASYDILAHPVMDLEHVELRRRYRWLLNGTQQEQRRIHNATGLSSKLLHMLFQITHLTATMTKDPESRITPRGATLIKDKLAKIRQWSELSDGYASEEELFAHCKRDENGLVATPAEVTDLTAQAWVSAAQIYLQCRFYRRPRGHPFVKTPLKTLIRCVKMMPCQGYLFTSQSPFFPIFIMSVVAVTDEERDTARNWFNTVTVQGSARSSVPPVWAAVKRLWVWMDLRLKEDGVAFEQPIAHRTAWWEQMVEYLSKREGLLSLS